MRKLRPRKTDSPLPRFESRIFPELGCMGKDGKSRKRRDEVRVSRGEVLAQPSGCGWNLTLTVDLSFPQVAPMMD
jgi:hypothetical protein